MITQNGSGAPFVDTFTIESSAKLTPLGQTTLRLPVQEALKTVRFDAERAYAITFRETDPLFTIDLSNAAAPAQKGELVIPGFVHHIEPRGNRLVALGFDRANPEGALNVSLFDVTSLTAPTMLARVSFGNRSDLNQLTEDQNRIHKSFRVFDDIGLVAVPFTSRYERYYGSSTCTPSDSGIQLIDWQGDRLQKRGLASLGGNPRRALMHEGRLLGVSDANIRSYSITNRDAPLATASVGVGPQCTTTQGASRSSGFQGGGYTHESRDYYSGGFYDSMSGSGQCR